MDMSRKVFVSYKYKDNDVEELETTKHPPTWPCDYVSFIEDEVLKNHIYKGEKQDEDLSDCTEEYIWDHLKDKMFDSTVTVLLISPNMKESGKKQRSQWIPWEISYSIKHTTRGGKTSQRNSIVAVILPDKNGKSTYFDKDETFPILRDNLKNGYIHLTYWSVFKKYPDYCIRKADESRENTPEYRLSIQL